jgi:dolichyl-phosphate beta-glucosyltransferase
MIFLSVIIPAYNEAERLPDTLDLVRGYLERQSFSSEVIVIDDGSKDATIKKVEEMQMHFSQLKLIANTENKGKGGVVRQGMLAATGEYRLFMDADHSTAITELDKFLPYIKDFDVIVGSRYLDKSSIKVKQPLKRRIVSRMGNLLIQKTLLPGIVDTRCGFKLFSAKAATAVFERQSMNGWAFDDEILTITREQGFSIKEIPVDWYDANDSKLRAAHAAASSYRDLGVIRKNVRAGIYK